ncbi:hypothetical protein I553_0889 [Mycobacterium xenopi 4042]|uniref:Uncharacterized protein n=1 Tax=Mycobacterium xenopi 4042 TaxID=1299334 RepID=X7YKN7_MYCXE|nr:hypothetical protein I553_0889 [Mycobacterium xenopi 4042]
MAAWSMAAARTRGRHGSRGCLRHDANGDTRPQGDYGIDGHSIPFRRPRKARGSP